MANARFTVNQFRELEVQFGREREVLITPRFLQNDTRTRAADYLRQIAAELNELQAAGEEEKVAQKFQEAAATVRKAEVAERCLELVSF